MEVTEDEAVGRERGDASGQRGMGVADKGTNGVRTVAARRQAQNFLRLASVVSAHHVTDAPTYDHYRTSLMRHSLP